MLNFKRQSIIAIDLSDYSVELMASDIKGRVFNARILLPEGVVEAGEILQPEVLAIKMKKSLAILASENNFDYKDAKIFASLPDSRSYVFCFSLPAKNKNERWEDLIREKVEKVLPTDFSNLYWSYTIHENKKEAKVVFAGAPKMIVEGYQKVFASAGLRLSFLGLECLTLGAAFYGTNKGLPFMIADLGFRTSNLSIFSATGKLEMVATVRLGGKHLTKALADGLNLPLETAENAKKTIGLSDKDDGSYALLTEKLRKLADSIGEAIVYYEKKTEKSLDKVILAGGTALLPGITSYLKTRLGREVIIGNLNVDLTKINSNLPVKAEILFANALGLLTIGKSKKGDYINFLAPVKEVDEVEEEIGGSDFNEKEDFGANNKKIYKVVGGIIFALLTVGLFGYLVYSQIFVPLKGDKTVSNIEPAANNEVDNINEVNSEQAVDKSVEISTTNNLLASQATSSTEVASSSLETATSSLAENAIATDTVASTTIIKNTGNFVVIKNTPTGWLNVRAGAGKEFPIIKKVLPGETYQLLEETAEWCKIELAENITGWVTTQYIDKQ